MNKNSLVVGIWEGYIKMYNVGVQALKIYYSLEGELKEKEEEEREVVLMPVFVQLYLIFVFPSYARKSEILLICVECHWRNFKFFT